MKSLTKAFLALHLIGGHIGLPILVLTFLFAKNVSRHPTLINFCVTWIVYSITYCLSFYGRWEEDLLATRSSALCMSQASLIQGAPAMCVLSGLFVVIRTWYAFQDHEPAFLSKVPAAVRYVVMLTPPYATFVGFSVGAGMPPPEMIDATNDLYCTIFIDTRRRYIVPAFCTLVVALVLMFEAATFINYHRRWAHIKRVFPHVDRPQSLSVYFRVGLFTIYSWVTLVACIFFLTKNGGFAPYILEAALPVVAVIVFGSHEDVLLTWCFCIRKRRAGTIPEFDVGRLGIGDAHSTHTVASLESPHMPSIAGDVERDGAIRAERS
ncbi:hypothetical protein PLICRDRAFT_50077 [Plicaturopsis crispa FD-325 SS-3]|nr:hypothetical protein PLICRDRAFT_50077 [Plicaturopsis crispa FD-325 SS-3]